jgi:hypothetical protein
MCQYGPSRFAALGHRLFGRIWLRAAARLRRLVRRNCHFDLIPPRNENIFENS